MVYDELEQSEVISKLLYVQLFMDFVLKIEPYTNCKYKFKLVFIRIRYIRLGGEVNEY